MKDLTVFILTHNRPQLVQTAIESVLQQKPFDFKFIVSDNSDNDETERILKEKDYFDKINYYHINVNGADRWRDVFSRVETEYFMVFHDDDEMYPYMIEKMYSILECNNAIAAIGANSDIYADGKFVKKIFRWSNKYIKDLGFLVKAYYFGDVAPFPSYIYKKECIADFPFDFPAGKFTDAVFIGNIVKRTKNMFWYKESCMRTNVHAGQDSATYDYLSNYGLYRYFANNTAKSSYLKKSKIKVFYGYLKNYKLKNGIHISRQEFKILFRHSLIYWFKLHVFSMLKKM